MLSSLSWRRSRLVANLATSAPSLVGLTCGCFAKSLTQTQTHPTCLHSALRLPELAPIMDGIAVSRQNTNLPSVPKRRLVLSPTIRGCHTMSCGFCLPLPPPALSPFPPIGESGLQICRLGESGLRLSWPVGRQPPRTNHAAENTHQEILDLTRRIFGRGDLSGLPS